MPPPRRRREKRLTPWRDPLPKPGPVFIFDIDGVVASMRKWESLLESPAPKWGVFTKHYQDATLIARGARLVDDAVDAGFQIVWSTTRPDGVADVTWRWFESKDLPTGPILGRHVIKDGAYRSAVDVKLRHWFWWNDHFGERNPVVAWIDDDNMALQALRSHGAPAWAPMRMQRLIVKAHGAPLSTAIADNDFDRELLQQRMDRKRPAWQKREDAYQEERAKWWDRTRLKTAQEREQRLKDRARHDRPPHSRA